MSVPLTRRDQEFNYTVGLEQYFIETTIITELATLPSFLCSSETEDIGLSDFCPNVYIPCLGKPTNKVKRCSQYNENYVESIKCRNSFKTETCFRTNRLMTCSWNLTEFIMVKLPNIITVACNKCTSGYFRGCVK